ncbi:hypothetical protein [Blastococcus atacamensis]|uniref:hypothetical protein n=1 Tax=Blastococcus atacamensis TaxID=2070508 RepID=UPI000CEB8BA4|nr:hypothetical protein [Blastococcus atacamensis]
MDLQRLADATVVAVVAVENSSGCGDRYCGGGPASGCRGGAELVAERSDTAASPASNTAGINRYAGTQGL